MLCSFADGPSSTVQETDKAVIDVEAQEDGIMGKILVRSLPATVIGSFSDTSTYNMTGPGRTEEHPGWKGHRTPSGRG
jgi:hypothetical protein